MYAISTRQYTNGTSGTTTTNTLQRRSLSTSNTANYLWAGYSTLEGTRTTGPGAAVEIHKINAALTPDSILGRNRVSVRAKLKSRRAAGQTRWDGQWTTDHRRNRRMCCAPDACGPESGCTRWRRAGRIDQRVRNLNFGCVYSWKKLLINGIGDARVTILFHTTQKSPKWPTNLK